jgi:hypothetical protein
MKEKPNKSEIFFLLNETSGSLNIFGEPTCLDYLCIINNKKGKNYEEDFVFHDACGIGSGADVLLGGRPVRGLCWQ